MVSFYFSVHSKAVFANTQALKKLLLQVGVWASYLHFSYLVPRTVHKSDAYKYGKQKCFVFIGLFIEI